MSKLKNYLTIGLFGAVLVGFSVATFAIEDGDISTSERRKLAQLPTISGESVLSGEYMEDLETYLLDQFPLRDDFRALKAWFSLDVLQKADNNGLYFVGDHALKMEFPTKPDQLAYGVNKMNQVIADYLQESRVYVSIIPDKNYFVDGYLKLDYDLILQEIQGVHGTYIDIFDDLELDDYYYGDAHWRQEAIFHVAEKLATEMGLGDTLAPEGGFVHHTLSDFQGVYWGHSALDIRQDDLVYVTSPVLGEVVVTSAEFAGETGVYAPEKFTGVDGYDVYLHGAQAILTLESPLAATDKELIIFRDSYGSSLAPYFAQGYSKITLVDLRYVNSSILPQFVDFYGQDVLFLYSTSILNSAMLLK